MAKTNIGYHSKTPKRKKPVSYTSFRKPSSISCCWCGHKFSPNEDRILELRPTGYKFQFQKYLYCMSCKERGFIDDERILYRDPESLPRVSPLLHYFYCTMSQTFTFDSCSV